jgi:hypothetical protein
VLRSDFIVLFIGWASAMYDSKDDVVELTSGNFQNQVINDDSIWIVEFYAPWCGHCKVSILILQRRDNVKNFAGTQKRKSSPYRCTRRKK